MPVAQGGVAFEGLKELAKALRSLNDKRIMNELKSVNEAAAREVISTAQGKASTRLQSAAAALLKPTKTAAYAAVRLGGAPYALGAEFGAVRGVPRQTARGTVTGWNQFEAWRGNGSDSGYFLYPAIRSKAPEIAERYADEIERIADDALGKVS